MRNLILAIFITILSFNAFAIDSEDYALTDSEFANFNTLTKKLRCLVCQNQSLADSNAELAVDLKHKVATLIKQGKTQEQVIDYLTARYGEFILYEPRLSQNTLLLWFGPLIVFGFGFIIFCRAVRNKSKC